MSNFNKKGWTTVPAQMPDGSIKHVPAKIGSSLHKRYLKGYKKWKRQQEANNRNFKNMQKLRKKMLRDDIKQIKENQ
jgi:hypothetical protein